MRPSARARAPREKRGSGVGVTSRRARLERVDRLREPLDTPAVVRAMMSTTHDRHLDLAALVDGLGEKICRGHRARTHPRSPDSCSTSWMSKIASWRSRTAKTIIGPEREPHPGQGLVRRAERRDQHHRCSDQDRCRFRRNSSAGSGFLVESDSWKPCSRTSTTAPSIMGRRNSLATCGRRLIPICRRRASAGADRPTGDGRERPSGVVAD
jgi:hypothetical protein